VVLESGLKEVSDPLGCCPAPPGPSRLGGVKAHVKRILLLHLSLPVWDNVAEPLPRRTALPRALRIE